MIANVWDSRVAAAAGRDGADHADAILVAYEMGNFRETLDSLDDVMDEWGTTDHLFAADVFPAVIPDLWSAWTAGPWTNDVDREFCDLWALYRERFEDAFMARVYANAARWHAVAVATGGVR